MLRFIWCAQAARGWMPCNEGVRWFDVFNVSSLDSNSHSTLSDRQPLLPGVASHGTPDDWTHLTILVTLCNACHTFTTVSLHYLARLVTHLSCVLREVSRIESFCKSFFSTETARGIQSVINTQWRIMYFITNISRGNTGLYLPSPSKTPAPTQANYFLCKTTQEERVTQKHSWNWDRPHHCLAAPTT